MKSQKSPLTLISTGEDKIIRMRRFVRISIVVLVTALIIWAYTSLNRSTTLPIKIVEVVGDYPHLNQQLFQRQLAAITTGGFFQVDVDAIKKQVLTFPWVYQVDVHKVFPNKIVIEIVEQSPIAQWNNNALLNANGELFSPAVTTFPTNLPLLTGPNDQASVVLATYERMNQMLKPLNLTIVAMDLSPRHAWRIELNNQTKVILGRFFIWQRLQTFIHLYSKVFVNAKQKAVSVDMRYPNGFAVQWK